MKKGVCVLGSTGSIGTQTLSIIAAQPDQFYVTALSAGRNIELLRQQIEAFRPSYVSVAEENDCAALASAFPDVKFSFGSQGACQAVHAGGTEIVVVGIVGFAALAPTLEAIQAKKRIALANKEALVVAGHLVKKEIARHGTEVIPVDSEHNALFQLLENQRRDSIAKLVLTASGGPLLRKSDLPLEDVTPALAVAHPNWKMGPKISVDSATLMNKGLELIEACQLFDVKPSDVEVWIHPQSIVHGAIWFKDNTCLAQLSRPDMRSSIGYALSYPSRIEKVIPKLSLKEMANLEFLPPDENRFPALRFARESFAAGPSHLIVLNAANEVVVQAFLDGKLLFPQMATCIEKTLTAFSSRPVEDIPRVYEIDAEARDLVKTFLPN